MLGYCSSWSGQGSSCWGEMFKVEFEGCEEAICKKGGAGGMGENPRRHPEVGMNWLCLRSPGKACVWGAPSVRARHSGEVVRRQTEAWRSLRARSDANFTVSVPERHRRGVIGRVTNLT